MQLIHDDAADTPNFPGAKATYTESMNFLLPDSYDGIPVYRVMDRQGNVINQSHDPQLSDDELLKMYKVRSSIQTVVVGDGYICDSNLKCHSP